MKHIFKKLHHQPNRSNETPQQPAPASVQTPSFPSSSDGRITSSAPASAPSTPVRGGGSAAVAEFTSEGNRVQQHQHQDYYSSEEEYQVQLALALSASSSVSVSAPIDGDNTLIGCGGTAENVYTDADLQSRRYWNYGFLDFEERLMDGFYDVYKISGDLTSQGNMPSLADLESNNGSSDYEVVIVSRKLDPALEELMQIAHCIMLDCPKTEIALLIKRLAELVTEHMGGPVRDANLLLAKWMERNIHLRTSLHIGVLPVGSLKFGLLRHRALLFKALADGVGIPCRLAKGSHYTGFEDDAINIIKLPDESECLVDLMGDPGILIPADVTSKDNTPLKLYNPQQSKFPGLQTIKETNISSKRLNQNFGCGHNFSPGNTSVKANPLPSLFDGTSNNSTGTYGAIDGMPSANQLDHTSSLIVESSFHIGNSEINASDDGVKTDLSVAPYSENSAETSHLFADLNPFQLKVSGKSIMNKLTNGVYKQPIEKNSFVNSQSLATSMRKSHYAWNEFSKRNEYDAVEDLSVKSQRDDCTNVPAVGSRISIAQSKGLKKSGVSSNSNQDKDDSSSSCNSFNVADRNENKLSFEVDSSLTDKETCFMGNAVTEREESEKNGHTNNFTKLQDHKENMKFRLNGTNMKMKETEASSLNYVDTVIDEVGECEILWENLVIGERIGLGSYGEVYHADWNDTEVAVKKFLDQDFSGAALDEFKREVRIMRRLRNPNVVLFMGAVTRPPNLSIVTEFLPRGSLYRIIHRPHCQLDEKRRIKMALDVAKGMNCLHTSTPTIVHRDLKSHNLLVDNNWNVKVGDFGLSRLKHNTFLSSKSTAGTPEWMAPEILRNEPSNEKCDVYSFGVILWELATLKLPWSEMNPIQVVGAVGFQNRRLDIPKEVDPLVSRIICECWQTDPNLRPSFAQLTVGLKLLQRLVVPVHMEQPTASSSPVQNSSKSTP